MIHYVRKELSVDCSTVSHHVYLEHTDIKRNDLLRHLGYHLGLHILHTGLVNICHIEITQILYHHLLSTQAFHHN